MNELNIRPAGPEDSATIYGFIMKMARYEKLESEVDTTEQALRKSLFEERQAEVVLGELNGRPVGFALFFHNFSTFRGRSSDKGTSVRSSLDALAYKSRRISIPSSYSSPTFWVTMNFTRSWS